MAPFALNNILFDAQIFKTILARLYVPYTINDSDLYQTLPYQRKFSSFTLLCFSAQLYTTFYTTLLKQQGFLGSM